MIFGSFEAQISPKFLLHRRDMASLHAPITVVNNAFIRGGEGPPTALVIGNFDGVHRGHQAVLRAASRRAAEMQLEPALLTFSPHPSEVLGRGAPPLLTTVTRRSELVVPLGIRQVFVRDFDMEFAAWSPDRFAHDLLAQALRAELVVVGTNFRFAVNRSGDFAALKRLGDAHGFEVLEAPLTGDNEGPFSSTRVRSALFGGDINEANSVLGHRHSIDGVVAHGAKRGRLIGFPTANLEQIDELLPSDGVYAVLVDEITDRGPVAIAPGVMNIGVRPTVPTPTGASSKGTVEVHLLNTDRDLYGARLRAYFVARLRNEQKFPSLDALKQAIAQDAVAAARATSSINPIAGAFDDRSTLK